MPGPKPKPTSLKLLQGNPGHRALPKSEPQPRPVAPDCPDYLGAVGRIRWAELLPELDVMGTMPLVDRDVLGAYCIYYERFVSATESLAVEETVVSRGTGGPMLNPWRAEQNAALAGMAKEGARFGMGAADRSKIEVKKQDVETEDPTAKAIGIAASRRR